MPEITRKHVQYFDKAAAPKLVITLDRAIKREDLPAVLAALEEDVHHRASVAPRYRA